MSPPNYQNLLTAWLSKAKKAWKAYGKNAEVILTLVKTIDALRKVSEIFGR